MSVFTIADLHLSFGCDKPMDIFRGWSDYTLRLEKNWRSLVKDTDTVVIPGDISWAMSLADAAADFAFIDSLPGTKIIGKGNHDYWWETAKKMNKFLDEHNFSTIKFLYNNAFLADGISICGTRGWFFDAEAEHREKILAREAGRLRTSIEQGIALGGKLAVFLHYPPLDSERKCNEIFDVLREYDIARIYFGHIHGESTGRYADFICEERRFSLISADFLAFCPKAVML